MDSQTYWRNRETEQRKHDIKDEQEYRKHIEEIYQNMIDEIEKGDQWLLRKVRPERGHYDGRSQEAGRQNWISRHMAGRRAKYVKERKFSPSRPMRRCGL